MEALNCECAGWCPQLKRGSLGREVRIIDGMVSVRRPFPTGGLELTVTYCTGSQSSYLHLPTLTPILCPIFGRALYEGSLNLYATAPVAFPSPARPILAGEEWLLAPIVLAETAAGVAARKARSGDVSFIEVFVPDKLAPLLGLKPGSHLMVRLLNGEVLELAA